MDQRAKKYIQQLKGLEREYGEYIVISHPMDMSD